MCITIICRKQVLITTNKKIKLVEVVVLQRFLPWYFRSLSISRKTLIRAKRWHSHWCIGRRYTGLDETVQAQWKCSWKQHGFALSSQCPSSDEGRIEIFNVSGTKKDGCWHWPDVRVGSLNVNCLSTKTWNKANYHYICNRYEIFLP